MITPERKAELIKEYATTPNDTGSPEVQVAVLSERISNLTEHFKDHGKDNHSRRGLIKMVSQRRGLLDYLKRTDEQRYDALIARLGLRRLIFNPISVFAGTRTFIKVRESALLRSSRGWPRRRTDPMRVISNSR